MQNHQLINQSSSEVEYFTPPEITEAARRVMGTIDLDPASSEAANRIVKAGQIFTKDDNGLSRPWTANTLWLNHPFGRAEKACLPTCDKKHEHHDYDFYGNAAWINYLDSECQMRVDQACCITFAATSEAWFQPLLKQPQCFLSPRTNYLLPDGTVKRGVSKGSVVTYYGKDVERFAKEFRVFGQIKTAY